MDEKTRALQADVDQLTPADQHRLRDVLKASRGETATMKIAVMRQLDIASPSVLHVRIGSDRRSLWISTADGVTRCHVSEIGTLIVEDESAIEKQNA